MLCPLPTTQFLCLLANPKARPGSLPPMPRLSCASTSHPWPFFFFFFCKFGAESSDQHRDRLWGIKRACVCLPVGPASPSSNHKAELSPALAVGGACGPEPCKQMSDADDPVKYLKKLKTDQKHTSTDSICLYRVNAKKITQSETHTCQTVCFYWSNLEYATVLDFTPPVSKSFWLSWKRTYACKQLFHFT